ncbi:MAG: hypothetical protein R6U78_14080 [Bacteroidales bacterium]
MRGERLFYGLIRDKFEEQACADCHNTTEIDTFNWNPDAVTGYMLTRANLYPVNHPYLEESLRHQI